MQHLSCNHKEDFKQVSDFSTLKSLTLSGFIRVADYESYLTKCTNLERLELNWDTTISNEIFKISGLQQLIIKNTGSFYAIPNEIALLHNLSILEVSKAYFDDISENISYLNKLTELNLSYNKLTQLPKTLNELTAIRHLNILGNKFTKNPEIALQLPKLNELFLDKKWYTLLQKKQPNILKQIPYIFGHSLLEKKYVNTLINICRKKPYSWNFRAVLFNLLANNDSKIEQFASFDDLLAATDILQIEIIRLKALEYIYKKVDNSYQKTLATGAKLAVIGKIGIKKTELRSKLKTQSIQYHSQIKEDTTHLLIGQLSKEAYKVAQEKGIPIITEKNILEYIEEKSNPYLLIGDKKEQNQNKENIASLLVSGSDDSIKIALTLFKEGGFPKGLITELLVAKGLSTNKEILRDIDRLYLQYASSELIDLTKKHMSIFNKYASETHVKTGINKISKHTEVSGYKLAKYIYAATSNARNYLLYNLPLEEKIDFIKDNFLSGKNLDLSSLELSSIPSEVYTMIELETLSIQRNKIKKIPAKIKNLKNLKVLDIRYNYHLTPQLATIQALLPNCEILSS